MGNMHFPVKETITLTDGGKLLAVMQVSANVADGTAESFETHTPLFRRLEEAARREFSRADPSPVVTSRIRGDQRGVDVAWVSIPLDSFSHVIHVG